MSICTQPVFLTTSYGTNSIFQTPGYPNFYPKNMTCIWKLETDEQIRHGIRLHIEDTQLHQNENCTNENVIIRSGWHETGKVMAKWCGSDSPTNIYVDDRRASVWFNSGDIGGRKRGFKIRASSYEVIEINRDSLVNDWIHWVIITVFLLMLIPLICYLYQRCQKAKNDPPKQLSSSSSQVAGAGVDNYRRTDGNWPPTRLSSAAHRMATVHEEDGPDRDTYSDSALPLSWNAQQITTPTAGLQPMYLQTGPPLAYEIHNFYVNSAMTNTADPEQIFTDDLRQQTDPVPNQMTANPIIEEVSDDEADNTTTTTPPTSTQTVATITRMIRVESPETNLDRAMAEETQL